MRLLHTADWHLGRLLHGVDLLDAQVTFMGELVELVGSERIDCVIIAGDVFDRPIPRVEAIRAYERTLEQLARLTNVIVISGNHDSAVRLGFAGGLLRAGVHFATQPDDLGLSVELADEHGPLFFHPIPYLEPDRLRADPDDPTGFVNTSTPRTHAAAMATAVRRSVPDGGRNGPRRVAVAHAFVAGGSVSDSERDIQVGGLGDVPSEVFLPFRYVALGHLHRCQQIDAPDGTIARYSGSPLRYSFSESNDDKSFLIIDIGPTGVDDVSRIPVTQPRAMANLTGSLAELLSPVLTAQHRQAWAMVTVTDEVRPARLHDRIRSAYPHSLVIRHQPPESPRVRSDQDSRDLRPASELATVSRFLAETTGRGPTATELRLIGNVLAAVNSRADQP